MPGYRGTFVGELTEQHYHIIDSAEKVAAELGTGVAIVALPLVQSCPGETSTVMNARTMEHLDANLKAQEIEFTPGQIAMRALHPSRP